MIGLAALGGLFVAYSLIASRLDRASVTPAMVFLGAGIVLGVQQTGLLPDAVKGELGTLAVELTLAILLFADASTVPLRDAEADAGLPLRLLLIGLPLTIAAGTVLGEGLFPAAGWASAALVATILAPTDSAVGLAVYTNAAVPVRVRRALNLESGLNDGLVTPFFTLFLAVLVSEDRVGAKDWGVHASSQIALAVLMAIVVGGVGGWLLIRSHRRGWTSQLSEQLAILSLAVVSYSASVAIGGNGFVSAFAAGIIFGRVTQRRMHKPVEFSETIGMFGSFFVWVLFGALVARPVLTHHFEPLAIAYAVLSLTAVRMGAVALALLGVHLRRETVAFMGWFGPRGLASVVFTVIAAETLRRANAATDMLLEVAVWTILLSVVAHGLSAGPLAKLYRKQLRGKPGLPELADAPEPRLRRRSLSGAAAGT